MAWVLKGLIFKPDGSRPWSRTHAQVPSALVLDDRIRVYYATRDGNGQSRTSFIEVDREDPSKVLYDHPEPVMELGPPGHHDENGVMVGCVLSVGDEVWMYYTGWSRCATIPYRVSCGLAISRDGGISFHRRFDGPVVDRTPLEPHMTMSPYVMREQRRWRMWYGSGVKWEIVDEKFEPVYVIKYAESEDGMRWNQPNQLCIVPLHPMEANTRPSVMPTADGLEMWFSYRHSLDFRDGRGAYRIGYATSKDGLTWDRQDDPAGLQPSGTGWNKKMMAYPCTVHVGCHRYMFHNGNGFGRSGMGYSEWISS